MTKWMDMPLIIKQWVKVGRIYWLWGACDSSKHLRCLVEDSRQLVFQFEMQEGGRSEFTFEWVHLKEERGIMVDKINWWHSVEWE